MLFLWQAWGSVLGVRTLEARSRPPPSICVMPAKAALPSGFWFCYLSLSVLGRPLELPESFERPPKDG